MEQQTRKYPHMFREGADAFGKFAAEEGQTWPYGCVCPICVHLYCDPSAFTREHVPPRSVGGKRMLLTCRDCNSTAGFKLDAHAAKSEYRRRFGKGDSDTTLRARAEFTESGIKQNVNVGHADGKLTIEGLPDHNPPGTGKRVEEMLDRRVKDTQGFPTIKLSFVVDRFDARNVELSWLRAAYLAAFACLGYRYALRPVLDAVRQQIQNPGNRLIEAFHLGLPSSDVNEKAVVLVEQPNWVHGLAAR